MKLKSKYWILSVSLLAAGAFASVSYSGGTYAQNFDTLASSGTGVTFNDNSTLPGWYAVSGNSGVVYSNGVNYTFALPGTETTHADAYNANIGGSSAITIYSYGATDASDRALGSISDQAKDFWYGFGIKNDTGSSLSDFTLTYDGEQWRKGTGTSAQNLLVYYRIGGADFDSSGTWTQLNDLTFTSPNIIDTGALDGNSSGNRTAGLTQTITQTVATGENVWFAWVDLDYEGELDHGLAIDNVSFTATVPEPATLSLFGISAILLIFIRRVRR